MDTPKTRAWKKLFTIGFKYAYGEYRDCEHAAYMTEKSITMSGRIYAAMTESETWIVAKYCGVK